MKLVIFGLTVTSSWGNGHATIWRGLLNALAAHGHAITFFERDVPYYAMHRDVRESPHYRIVLYSDWQQILPQATEEVDAADAAIVTSYCPDAAAASELMHSLNTCRKIFYDLDTPVTLHRLEHDGRVDYVPPEGLRGFDLVLSYTGGRALDALQSRLGAKAVAPLYGSVDPALHKPTAPAEQYRAHLSYLGTYAADRQEALEKLFLEPARALPEKRFLIGGAQYPQEFPWSPNVYFVRHIPPALHSAFYSSSTLTLNVTRAAMVEMGYCPSGRLFEAAACGTPIVSDWWEGLDEFFEPDREIVIAESAQDVLRALALPRETLRRIGEAARARTLEEHTAECRARELINILASAATSTTTESANLLVSH